MFRNFIHCFLLLNVIVVLVTAQIDTLHIYTKDGKKQSYSLKDITQIKFVGNTTEVQQQNLIQQIIFSFTLRQNYPNPFNPTTKIEYEIPQHGEVEALIFDVQGRVIRTFEKRTQDAGLHSIVWNGRNDAGQIVSSGSYFFDVKYNGRTMTKKLMLIK